MTFLSQDNNSISESHNVDILVKYILLYETPKWMDTVRFNPPDMRCIVTNNRSYLPKIEMFDAVLFSGQNSWKVEKIFPKVRSPHQYYVFVDLECPQMSFHKFSVNANSEIYNITMTYRRDSDVYWPYGFITNQNTTYLSAAEDSQWLQPIFDEDVNDDLLKKIGKKTKIAAWFVSNCNGKSQRAYLATAMQKTIDVDIYGKCGPFECPRSTTEACYELVDQDYFFYLSFENSLCNDYITEKVFNILRYDVVPVVYGGANYTQHLPPHSYIDANDFANATDLANYLKSLTMDIKKYAKYFWWKKYYKTVVSGKVYNNLCDKLHEYTSEQQDYKRNSFYKNIKEWWEKDQCTDSRKIRFV